MILNESVFIFTHFNSLIELILEPVAVTISYAHELVLDDVTEERSWTGRSEFHEACREDVDVLRGSIGLHQPVELLDKRVSVVNGSNRVSQSNRGRSNEGIWGFLFLLLFLSLKSVT